jgi:hypothetical protein
MHDPRATSQERAGHEASELGPHAPPLSKVSACHPAGRAPRARVSAPVRIRLSALSLRTSPIVLAPNSGHRSQPLPSAYFSGKSGNAPCVLLFCGLHSSSLSDSFRTLSALGQGHGVVRLSSKAARTLASCRLARFGPQHSPSLTTPQDDSNPSPGTPRGSGVRRPSSRARGAARPVAAFAVHRRGQRRPYRAIRPGVASLLCPGPSLPATLSRPDRSRLPQQLPGMVPHCRCTP